MLRQVVVAFCREGMVARAMTRRGALALSCRAVTGNASDQDQVRLVAAERRGPRHGAWTLSFRPDVCAARAPHRPPEASTCGARNGTVRGKIRVDNVVAQTRSVGPGLPCQH